MLIDSDDDRFAVVLEAGDSVTTVRVTLLVGADVVLLDGGNVGMRVKVDVSLVLLLPIDIVTVELCMLVVVFVEDMVGGKDDALGTT